MEQHITLNNLNGIRIPEHINEALTTFAISMYHDKLETYAFECAGFSGAMNTDFVERLFLFIRCLSFEFNINVEEAAGTVKNYQGTFAIQKDVLEFDSQSGFKMTTSPSDEIIIPVTEENAELINHLINEGKEKLN